MIKPTMTPIKSSMATHAHYDDQDKSLLVRFKNGDTFKYKDIPANIGHTVIGADSFGSSFNRHVTGKYTGTKL